MNIRRSRTLSKQSNYFAKKKREQAILRYGLSSIILIIVVWAASFIVNLKSVNISSTEVYGIDTETTKLIRQKVNETIDGKYFGLFSKSNIFLYPKDKIATAIQAITPRIDQVNINLKDRDILTVSIKEKAGQAIVCNGLPEFLENKINLEKSDACYFVDQNGIIFSEAPVFSGAAYKRYYVPDIQIATSSPNLIGSQVLDSVKFKKVEIFYDAVRQARITAQAILIKLDGEYELYISNPTQIVNNSEDVSSTAVVYLDSKSSLEDQLANLVSFWTNQLSVGRSSGKMPVFDSIDVRYGSNVFYRLNN